MPSLWQRTTASLPSMTRKASTVGWLGGVFTAATRWQAIIDRKQRDQKRRLQPLWIALRPGSILSQNVARPTNAGVPSTGGTLETIQSQSTLEPRGERMIINNSTRGVN
eukprot:scpid37824/ scgid14372/ 